MKGGGGGGGGGGGVEMGGRVRREGEEKGKEGGPGPVGEKGKEGKRKEGSEGKGERGRGEGTEGRGWCRDCQRVSIRCACSLLTC